MDNLIEDEILKKVKTGNFTVSDICKEYNIDLSMYYRIIKRNGREKLVPNKKYTVNDSYFENINSEEKAYWLGFIYADGYINDSHRNKFLELGLSSIDRDHIIKFSKSCESNHPIKNRVISKNYKKIDGNNCESTHIKIYSTKIVNDLIKIGCGNKKTWKIVYPDFLKIDLHCHFIRGYFDGDGNIYKPKGGINRYVVSIAGNKLFLEGLNDILKNNLITDSYILTRPNNLSILTISNYKDCLSFYNLIYNKASVFLERKKEYFDRINIKYPSKLYSKYKIISPSKEIFFIENGLRKFCVDKGIDYLKIKNLLKNKSKDYLGWSIEKIENIKELNHLSNFNNFKNIK